MIDIEQRHNNTDIILRYTDNGVLEHVINVKTQEKMTQTIVQEGCGYEFIKEWGFTGCKATMVGLFDLGIYVPKFLFIKKLTRNKHLK